MSRLICASSVGAIVAMAVAAALPASASAGSPQACVSGHSQRCFPSLAEAVAHTVNGDLVTLGAGTYAGGVTITKSIRVVGAGEDQTVVSGGGPVVTIKATSKLRPTVEMTDLSVSGGRNTGVALTGKRDGFNAHGGGIQVPYANRAGKPGATLVLRHVTVSGNQAIPSMTSPSPSGVQCPGGDCPYAGAYGGGIATAGPLTLDDVTVSGNRAAGRVSDANGAGIYSRVGPVVIRNSKIVGNTAEPTPHTIGRFAEGGGITIVEGSKPTTVQGTHIDDNVARLVTDWPDSVDMSAQSGGVFMEGDTELTMRDSVVSGNRVIADAPQGEPLVYVAALHFQHGGNGLLLEDTTITGNQLHAVVRTTENLAPMGGIVESDGHAVMNRVRITHNTQSVRTTDGSAGVSGAVFLCGCDNGDGGVTQLTDVTVSENLSAATSEAGPAWVWGGGIFAADATHLTLASSTVSRNRSVATALDGSSRAEVRGGGVWAGPLWGADPTVDLSGSTITGNSGTVSEGGTVLGGGVYAEVPVTGTEGVTGNLPDDVYSP